MAFQPLSPLFLPTGQVMTGSTGQSPELTLCPVPIIRIMVITAIVIVNLCWAFCVLSPIALSQPLQIDEVRINLCESRLPHSTIGCCNFPTGYGPLRSTWIGIQAFPLVSEDLLLILQMSQLKHLLSKCSLNLLHSFSRARAAGK